LNNNNKKNNQLNQAVPQWVYSFMIARSFHNLSLSAACGEKQVQTAIDAFFLQKKNLS